MRIRVVWGTVALTILPVGVSRPAAALDRPQSALVSFLDRYAAGDHGGPVAALSAVGSIQAWARMFQQDGPAWVAAGATPVEMSRRRLAFASLLLEVTHARLQEDWADLRDLVELACGMLRTDAPGPAELAWQRAAMAVIQGAWDARFLTTPPPLKEGQEPPRPLMHDHAAHVRARFPDEPRFGLAEAFVIEARAPREAFPAEPATGPMTRRATLLATATRQRLVDALDAFTPWLEDPAVGAEAHLHAGYLKYRMGDAAAALEAYARAAGSADAFVSYLAHFFAGRALERQDQRAEAEAAYRRALQSIPGAHSGAVALSTLLFLSDRPDEAYAVMDAANAVVPAPVDPWRVYGYGDLRLWPSLRPELRRLAAPTIGHVHDDD